MKPYPLRPAITRHSSLLTSATSWMDARRQRIQRQKVEKGTVPQVNHGGNAMTFSTLDIADSLIFNI